VPVYPYRRCAYSDGDKLPVQEVSQFEGAEAARVSPRELQVFLNIPMKIVVFRYYAGIVTSLSIWTMNAATPEGAPQWRIGD
jgi:hypothetical protein